MPWTIERKHDHVVVVTMNTNKVNAQNPTFFDDLHAALANPSFAHILDSYLNFQHPDLP